MTSRPAVAGWLLLSLASLAACGSSEHAARARAANDFSCPEAEITMTKLDDGAYQAQGCGEYGVYRCTSQQDDPRDAVTYDCARQGSR